MFGISVEDYDCRLLRPAYGTHDGSPPSADMFGITTHKNWSKMRSSYTIVNVVNTATETADNEAVTYHVVDVVGDGSMA